MVRRSTAQVEAREQARARLAERHAASRAREKANEDDLIAFLALDADLDTAATTRDAAITAATQAYETAVAATHTAQSEKVAAMVNRGETVADLTGWTTKQVRTATKTTPTSTAAENTAQATDTTGDEDSPNAGGEQQAL